MSVTKKKAVTKKKVSARRTVTIGNDESNASKLITLYLKKQQIEAEIKQLKDELKKEILFAEKQTIKTDIGTIALKTSNAWSLPPVNETKAREILKESFTFYFKEKLSFGVEQIAKNEINSLTELGQQLSELVEIKTTESWEIKPA